MECNNYNLINNEIITFYKDDKLMVTDLVYKLNDNEISDITGLLKEEILKKKIITSISFFYKKRRS